MLKRFLWGIVVLAVILGLGYMYDSQNPNSIGSGIRESEIKINEVF